MAAERGEPIVLRGVGNADFTWGIPNTPDTRFLLGSVTKQFTAALVLRMAERGELALSDPITRWLPGYPSDPGDRITIDHLLRHTSGIPEYWPIRAFHEDARRGADPGELVEHFSHLPLDFPPGTEFNYSNSGYLLLGLIIENVSGSAFSQVLRDELLDPLGLEQTGYAEDGVVVSQLATGYRWIAGEVQQAEHMPAAAGFSAAMMYSTVGDLLRWSRALHAGEVFRDRATLERMMTPGLGDYGYGLEIHTRTIGGVTETITSHEGGLNGFGTMMHYAPASGRMVVAADNTQRSVVAIADGILRLLYGEWAPDPRRPIADILRPIIREQGTGVARATYARLRMDDPEGYDFREFQLNRLGYELLGQGDAEAAVVIFGLNAEQFPDSFNTWDSLGEGYLAAGQRGRAVQSYQRSLQLNPANQNAEQLLRDLGAIP